MNDRGSPGDVDGFSRPDAAEDEFDAVAEVVDGGVLRVDADGRIVDADSAFRALSPAALETVEGELLSSVFGEDTARPLRGALNDGLSGPAGSLEGTVSFDTAPNQRREFTADVRAAPDEAGGVVVLRESESSGAPADGDSGSEAPEGSTEEAQWSSRQSEVLSRLYEFATESETPLPERIRGVLSVVRNVAGTEYGTLARVEDDTYVFEVVNGADGAVSEGDTLALSETNCERVVEHEETLVLRDIQSEAPNLAARAGNQELGLSCYLGAPVVLDGEVYGAVCVYGSDTCEFSEWAVSLVEVAAALVEYELEQERAKEGIREERELAEAARRRYETLVENFPNGAVALVDEDLRYTTAGGTPVDSDVGDASEIMGQRIRDAVADEFADVLEPKYRAALAGERSDFEYETDGSVVRIRTFPVRDDDGTIVAAMGMSQDVTEQKERERELSKYESLVETVNDGIYVTDTEYRYTTVNDAFVELTGYSREELLGAPASLVVDDETIESARAIREGDGSGSLETTMERADGTELPVEVTFSSLETADGTEERVGVVRDVSERRERRRRIEESEQRYRTLVENFPNGSVGLFDEDLEYTAVGGELVDETDVDPADRVGQSVYDIYPEELTAEIEPHFQAALEGETRSFDVEYHGLHLSAQTLPVRDPDGEVDAGMIVVQDVTERTENRRKLEESEQRYRALVENLPDGGVGVYDEDLRYTLVDGTMWEDHEYDAADLEGEYIWEALPDDTAADVEPVFEAALEGETGTVDSTLGGRTYRVWATPLRDADGEITAGQSIALDVTEQKERERYLEDVKAQMEAAAEAGAVGTWEWHIPEDRFVAGASLAQLFGVDPERAREGVPLEELTSSIHEEDREDVQAAIEDAVESCGEYEEEYRVYDADDELRWVVARGHVECDGNGNPQTFPGAITDITEQKHVERELDRKRNQLETLFGVLPVGVVVAESDGELVEANDVAEDIWGGDVFDASSIEEYERYDMWWEDTGEPVAPDEMTMAKVLRGETVEDPDIIRIEDANGEERILMVHGMPVFDADGAVDRGVVTLTDITERREYQRKLEASNERLEQFAYAASHDLQEPLRMISSYLSLIESRYEDVLDEDGEEFIEYAVDGADRMQEMIDALLQYSRVETEGADFEPVDLDAVFADVYQDYELKVQETDADVSVGSLPTVPGDEDQLRQVFGNLLSNAIEYSGDDPPAVEVSAHRDGDSWVVAVEDDGIGIDPEHADRVFDVFQRLHAHDEHSGTGIGLALCERIVERHGGDIWVESEPGEGSIFYLRIPDERQADD
jgi:PAS domain S-box-containing protein